MKVQFFEAALQDLDKSFTYYSEIDRSLGEYFMSDIEESISIIKSDPFASSRNENYPHLRIKLCRRFPFSVIYHPDEESNTVYIVAVAHQKRKPNYWSGRLD